MAQPTGILPSSTVTGLPSGDAFAATGFPDVPVFMGPASKGPINVPTRIGAGNITGAGGLTATFGAGATVKRCARAMSLIAQGIVFVRTTTASVAATRTAPVITSATLAGFGALSGNATDGADVVVTCSSTGTTGTAFSYTLSLDGGVTTGAPVVQGVALTIVVLGVTLTLTTAKVITAGDTITWFQAPASSTVLPLNVAGMIGSSVPTVTGTPVDAYEGRMEFRSPNGDATVGTALAGAQYRYALDAGATNPSPTFTAWTTLGTLNAITLLDGPISTEPTGLTYNLAAGTVKDGDFVTWTTTAAAYDSAGATAALTALAGWEPEAWSWVRLCGPVTEALGSAVATIGAGWETAAPGPKWLVVDVRDRATHETLAAWSARIQTEWTPFVTTWCGFSAGMGRASDGGINGRSNRAPAFDVGYVPRAMGLPLHIDAGEFDLGPLAPDVRISDANDITVEHDANSDSGILAIGGLVLRRWPGQTGVYPAGSVLPGPPNDIGRIPYRRVQNVAAKIQQAGQLSSILKPTRLIPQGSRPMTLRGYAQLVAGDIDPVDIKRINTGLTAKLQAALIKTGYAVDVVYRVDQTPIQLGGGAVKFTGKAKINGFVYPVTFIGTVQFVS